MRPAAELDRVAGDLDDAHDVPVLLAEEHHRPEPAGFLDRRLEDVHRQTLEDLLVDATLDLVALVGAQRLSVREVEAELVRADGRAGLQHVLAEHVAQRLVEQMRSGVVRHRREADVPARHRSNPVSRRRTRRLGRASAWSESKR